MPFFASWVYKPFSFERKSGMPRDVEIPAPVKTMIFEHNWSSSTASSNVFHWWSFVLRGRSIFRGLLDIATSLSPAARVLFGFGRIRLVVGDASKRMSCLLGADELVAFCRESSCDPGLMFFCRMLGALVVILIGVVIKQRAEASEVNCIQRTTRTLGSSYNSGRTGKSRNKENDHGAVLMPSEGVIGSPSNVELSESTLLQPGVLINLCFAMFIPWIHLSCGLPLFWGCWI